MYSATNVRPTTPTTTTTTITTTTLPSTVTTTLPATSTTELVPLKLSGAELEPGLVAEWYDFQSGDRSIAAIDPYLSHWGKKFDRLAVRWTGLLKIETPGAYRFYIQVLGDGDLHLDDETLLSIQSTPEQAAVHQPVNGTTKQMQVAAGDHELVIRYSEEQGLAGIRFEYEGPDNLNLMSPVPRGKLFHRRGPCSLRDIPRVLSPVCIGSGSDIPRWALGDGERCIPRCEVGYFPGGMSPSALEGAEGDVLALAAATCQKGNVTPADFACEEMRCSSPEVVHANSPSCKEGEWIRAGEPCTPSCRPGFAAHTWGVLRCYNGTLAGSFHCVDRPAWACDTSSSSDLWRSQGPEPCAGADGSVQHGGTCVARCEDGKAADMNLTCIHGRFEPSGFDCLEVGAEMLGTLGNSWRRRRRPSLSTAAKGTVELGSDLPWWAFAAAARHWRLFVGPVRSPTASLRRPTGST